MKSCVTVCAMLLSFLVIGCRPSSSPQGGDAPATDKVSAADAKPAKPGDKQQEEKPTVQNDKKAVLSAENQVVEFLATREMLTQVFLDHTSPIRRTRLQPHFIDWLALGVNEPLDQRLALAQVSHFGHTPLKDKNYFDGGYRDSVLASLDVGGLIGCKVATQLLRENKDYAKNYLTIADRDLASDVLRKLIASSADTMDKGFDSELAGYTARTLAFMKKDAPPEMAASHAALREAIREVLPKHPELTASLKGKIKIAADVRTSHERVSKMIRAASGG